MGTEEHTSGGLNNQHKYLHVNGIPGVLAAGFLMAAKARSILGIVVAANRSRDCGRGRARRRRECERVHRARR